MQLMIYTDTKNHYATLQLASTCLNNSIFSSKADEIAREGRHKLQIKT